MKKTLPPITLRFGWLPHLVVFENNRLGGIRVKSAVVKHSVS